MHNTESRLDNYSHSTVPESELVSGWYVANIINGVAVAMPAFLVGAKFMTALGTVQGTGALMAGGAILAMIAAANMYVAVLERKNTVSILDRSFGRVGQIAISVLVAVSLLGWYGVTVSLFGAATNKAIAVLFAVDVPVSLLVVLGSALMVSTTIYGFRAIDWLSRISVPLMALILAGGAYRVLSDYPLSQILGAAGTASPDIPSFYAGVSIIVGAFMAGVVLVPDYARFIRNSKQIVPVAISSYGSFAMLVMVVAGLPALMTGESDLIVSMYQVGLGMPALIIMILASWTTNVNNLYSAELGLAQLFPQVSDWKLTAVSGVLGTLLALGGILDHIFSFLYFLAILIPPISGIYLAHFLTEDRSRAGTGDVSASIVSPQALIAWILASTLAFLTASEYFVLTKIPALDAWLGALSAYWVLRKIWGR